MEKKKQEEIVQEFVEWCESDFGMRVMDKEAQYIRKALDGYDKILDVGCGIGSIEERLPDLNITGVDSSQAMLKEARTRSNKRFIRGKAEDLPFADESFDAVFSLTTLEFVEEYTAAIDEIYRVLRTNGTCLILLLNPHSAYFKTHISKPDSYFHNFKHPPQEIESYADQYFELDTEYFLGIRDKQLVNTTEKALASLYVLHGRKIS